MNDIKPKRIMYKKYHFFFMKKGSKTWLLTYTITTSIKKYCKKGFSDQ